jgi:hypothetical protein
MDLSQYKPSRGFLDVFGDRPFKPLPGETHNEMRGRQVSYQQRIRDWDAVTPAELPAHVADLLAAFSFGLGQATAFTSSQREGVYVIFPYDVYMDPRRVDGRDVTSVVINAQADYIQNVGSLPPVVIFPGQPGLKAMNEAKRAEEAAAMADAEDTE